MSLSQVSSSCHVTGSGGGGGVQCGYPSDEPWCNRPAKHATSQLCNDNMVLDTFKLVLVTWKV